ncbi:MAG TPA: FAD-binding protein [Actinomycetota bacterium]
METLHPHVAADVAEALRAASAAGTRVLPVGGRRHLDRGNPCAVDIELWTTQLDEVVAYEPAEMIAVVGAGLRVRDLQAALAEGGQEWPVDAPGDATVGGVIAAGASSPRRLRVGTVRDLILQVELATGDGRLVRAGARTVKQSTGYGIARAAVGSLGTLGVLTEVAIKVRPLPKVHRSVVATGPGLELGRRVLDAVPLPAAVVAEPEGVLLRLEGWPEEVEEQTAAARTVTEAVAVEEDEVFPTEPFPDAPIVAEVSLPPSRLPDLLDGRPAWRALLGVGTAWVPLASEDDLAELRARGAELGGIAPVIRGPGGLGDAPLPAIDVHRRLKDAFDPAGILAPGRFWAGL